MVDPVRRSVMARACSLFVSLAPKLHVFSVSLVGRQCTGSAFVVYFPGDLHVDTSTLTALLFDSNPVISNDLPSSALF